MSLPKNGRPWTAQDDRDLRRYAAAGLSNGSIALRLARHKDVVRRRRKVLGI